MRQRLDCCCACQHDALSVSRLRTDVRHCGRSDQRRVSQRVYAAIQEESGPDAPHYGGPERTSHD
ncbi:hypothetical protein CCP3SC1AL1_470015 [Gammaproteobacteria bacterium]